MNLGISREWRCQHVCFDVAVGFIVTVVAAAILISYVPPAWAMSFSFGSFVVDLGDLPPWIGAIVALAIWWDARKAKKNAAEAAEKAATGVAKIEAVAHQIDGLLADRDRAKVREGEDKGKQAGVVIAATLALGQRQGAEAERESVAAAVAAAPAPVAHADTPLPVADDKATKAGERVAAATEKMADTQQRVADSTKPKTEI